MRLGDDEICLRVDVTSLRLVGQVVEARSLAVHADHGDRSPQCTR